MNKQNINASCISIICKKNNKRMKSNRELISNFIFQGSIIQFCISCLKQEKNLSNMVIEKKMMFKLMQKAMNFTIRIKQNKC